MRRFASHLQEFLRELKTDLLSVAACRKEGSKKVNKQRWYEERYSCLVLRKTFVPVGVNNLGRNSRPKWRLKSVNRLVYPVWRSKEMKNT